MNAGDDINAQVRDLRAEVERLTRERDEAIADANDRLDHVRQYRIEAGDAQAEVARLRAARAVDLAEVARLRGALERIAGEATTPLVHAAMLMRDEARMALGQEQP